LLAVILYGVVTGELGHKNPWDAGPIPPIKVAEKQRDSSR
jgi:hypothetical protein